MNYSLLLFAAFSASASALAAPAPAHHLSPSAPRTVVVLPSAAPPVIRTGLLQSTLIELPDAEKVATVFGGDTQDWIFDGGHVASRYISIKPKVPNSTTDVHIISDHGNEYTLSLQEISSDPDPHFDSNVMLEPGDKAGKDKMAELPTFVPASEVAGMKQQVLDAQATVKAEEKASATAEEVYQSRYPGTLRFDYTWDRPKGKDLGIQEIWHDDRFTYIRGVFQETPALYETKDKKGSLINFDFANGLYTVPKLMDKGYLSIGKEKVDFSRIKEGN